MADDAMEPQRSPQLTDVKKALYDKIHRVKNAQAMTKLSGLVSEMSSQNDPMSRRKEDRKATYKEERRKRKTEDRQTGKHY